MSGEYGVLLYYKYAAVEDVEGLVSFYQSNCDSLSLLGRVRLSPTGVNVTVGGHLRSLEKHIEAVKSMSMFQDTDFKLAACHSPLDDAVARQCGFTSLSIRVVKELVTFSSYPLLKAPDVSEAGKHLSAVEFHSVLQNAVQLLDAGSASESKGVVLLDARNLYETRIGKFYTSAVETLDPGIRQYSDLPSWIDGHAEQLQGKHVLMYCTGGIRCEMASAYIKSKGAGFENVFQLFGGIQRYLEEFPDGGYFKGKNFVFDHRISVGSSDGSILGSCLLCGLSFDDYSSRCRCSYCRMLVLVCDKCQADDAIYVCELCRKQGKDIGAVPLIENCKAEEMLPEVNLGTMLSGTTPIHRLDQGLSVRPSRKLRILCLHGFRQNASSFKGRTASLAKKLKNLVEFVYVDAPHELPFIYRASYHDASSPPQQVPPENCNRKFAWLIASGCSGRSETEWKLVDAPFDALQYQQQTEGFEDSLAHVRTVFSLQGPFDGILGFSQGAAMAALLCMQRQREKNEMEFRFAILCSGFPVGRLAEAQSESIDCPSLHIFGSLVGADRQITNDASRNLATLFVKHSAVVIEHDSGHVIPTRPPYIDNIRSFLQRFVC